jgi:RNA polymerase sigma-70 factor, ECF subfamily
LTDHDAIERLKNGDIGGLEALVYHYQVKATRTAYLITHDRQLAEDAMQTAFIRLYENIHHFDLHRPFEPYFMRIVVNAALKLVGSQNRTLQLGDDMADLLPDITEFSGDPARHFDGKEDEQAVREALQKLTPDQRAVIVMRYYLGYSESEISQEIARPIGTVRWRMHAAHQQLRGLLGLPVRRRSEGG